MFPLFRRKIIQRYHSLLPADAPPPNLQGRKPVILCIGAIGGRKAQIHLVQAFASVAARRPQWRLEIIGRIGVPEDYEQILSFIRREQLSDRIGLPGRLSDAEILAHMQSASIIAMPSLQEGLGLSLQEALFHSCVGIGSRVGGIPELIEHERNGLLTPPGDVPALAAGLDRLMGDPPFLESLREQTRPSILRKGMTATAMVQDYLNLYRQLLKVCKRSSKLSGRPA